MSRQEGSVKYAWGRKMFGARPNNLERDWRMGRREKLHEGGEEDKVACHKVGITRPVDRSFGVFGGGG